MDKISSKQRRRASASADDSSSAEASVSPLLLYERAEVEVRLEIRKVSISYLGM